MKKHLRKLSALLLTLVLAISLAPAALAAPTTVADTPMTFKDVKPGDTVTAYRMVEYSSDYSSFNYHDAFKTFLEGKKGTTSESLDDWFSTLPSADLKGYLTEYTEQLQAGAAGYDLPPKQKVAGTVATGETSTTLHLAPGFYLVLTRTTTANSRVYTPVAVFVRVMGDHSVKVYAGGTDLPAAASYTFKLKSQPAPVITKLVRNTHSDLHPTTIPHQPTASSGVGTNYGVEFMIQVTIPYYQGDPHFSTLTITDTLKNAELTTSAFSTPVSIHKKYNDTDGSFDDNLNEALKNTNIGTYDPATGEQKIILDLDYDKLKNTAGADTVFYIQYYARLKKDAIDTDTTLDAAAGTTTNMGKNTAKLTYALATDPTVKKETDPKSTSIYTYSIKLEKKDMDGTTPLTGAKFRLYRDAAMHDEVLLAKDADKNFYYPADVGAAGVEIDTGADSSFLIKGLEQGVYYLKETATKAGYYLPKGVFEIRLTDEGNTTTNRRLTGKLAAASTFTAKNTEDDPLIGGTATVDPAAVNQLDIVLKNSSQPILPSTGGMGTALFTFGGVALMVLAAGLTIYMRKRKEN